MLCPRQPNVRHARAQARVQQNVAALHVAVQERPQPPPGRVEVRKPRRSIRSDPHARSSIKSVVDAGCESLIQTTTGHEGVHQAGLLLAVLQRKAEAQQRYEVRVAVNSQDRQLPQKLGDTLERRLAQPNVRTRGTLCNPHTGTSLIQMKPVKN